MNNSVKVFLIFCILFFSISTLASCKNQKKVDFDYGIGEITSENEDLIMFVKNKEDVKINKIILDSKYDDNFFSKKSLIVIGIKTKTSGEKINEINIERDNKQLNVNINATVGIHDALGFVSLILEVNKSDVNNAESIKINTNLNRFQTCYMFCEDKILYNFGKAIM